MVKLSERQLDAVAKAAAEVTLEYLEKKEKQQEKKKHDRRLRNIKLLLRNYRTIALHCSGIKIEVNQLDEKIDLADLDTDEFKLASIKRSKERTLAMFKFTNKMLEVYRIICEESNRPEDLRRYQVVYHMYIAEQKMTAEKIAELQNTSLKTVYNDIDNACKTLSVLVFGVDGIRFLK